VLEEELSSALSRYWSTAARILQGSGIHLVNPGPAFFSLENNFFSTLFLYSYHRMNIPKPRRILYATVNQCLRGMVTGCDNLLDDEYKKTLDTDLRWTELDFVLSRHGVRRSFQGPHKLKRRPDFDQVITVLHHGHVSGAREASKKRGTKSTPGKFCLPVHHYKTEFFLSLGCSCGH
jgi:hypothetical protein